MEMPLELGVGQWAMGNGQRATGGGRKMCAPAKGRVLTTGHA